MKFFDLFRRFSRRTITGASLPLAASFLLAAAPLRAEFAFLSQSVGITTYTIGSNGVLSQVGSPLPEGYLVGAQAMDPKGRFVFFLGESQIGYALYVYSIGSNGTLTLTRGSPVTLPTSYRTLNVDPTGKFLYLMTDVNANQNVILAYSSTDTGPRIALRDWANSDLGDGRSQGAIRVRS